MKGRQHKLQQRDAPEAKAPPLSGSGPADAAHYDPTLPARATKTVYYAPMEPYAALKSTPTNSHVRVAGREWRCAAQLHFRLWRRLARGAHQQTVRGARV